MKRRVKALSSIGHSEYGCSGVSSQSGDLMDREITDVGVLNRPEVSRGAWPDVYLPVESLPPGRVFLDDLVRAEMAPDVFRW